MQVMIINLNYPQEMQPTKLEEMLQKNNIDHL